MMFNRKRGHLSETSSVTTIPFKVQVLFKFLIVHLAGFICILLTLAFKYNYNLKCLILVRLCLLPVGLILNPNCRPGGDKISPKVMFRIIHNMPMLLNNVFN